MISSCSVADPSCEVIESLAEGDGIEEVSMSIDSVSNIISAEEEGAAEDIEVDCVNEEGVDGVTKEGVDGVTEEGVDGVTEEGISTEGDGFSREDDFIEVDCFPEKDESSKEVAFCCVSLPLDCGLRI